MNRRMYQEEQDDMDRLIPTSRYESASPANNIDDNTPRCIYQAEQDYMDGLIPTSAQYESDSSNTVSTPGNYSDDSTAPVIPDSQPMSPDTVFDPAIYDSKEELWRCGLCLWEIEAFDGLEGYCRGGHHSDLMAIEGWEFKDEATLCEETRSEDGESGTDGGNLGESDDEAAVENDDEGVGDMDEGGYGSVEEEGLKGAERENDDDDDDIVYIIKGSGMVEMHRGGKMVSSYRPLGSLTKVHPATRKRTFKA